jgi:hypothetical protein
MTTNDEVLAMDERRLKAMIAGDIGELEKLLHRDLKYTHSSGLVDSKDSYIRGVREKLWDYQSIRTSNEAVSVYGETALVHCRLQIDLEVKGTPRQVDSLALTVWIKDEGRWQVLAVHSTPHPKG